MYSDYGIAFDWAGSWSFGNEFAKNVIILAVDKSLLSHVDNRMNKFLLLGVGPTNDNISKAGTAETKLVLILVKQRQNLSWFCITRSIKVIYLLIEKKSITLRPVIKI